MSNELKVAFEFEKETKSTIRFKETAVGPLDSPIIGTLYVPKPTLKQLGYEEGKGLIVGLAVK